MIVPASDCSYHLDSRSYSAYSEQYYSLVTKRNGDVNNHIAEHHLQTKHQSTGILRHVLRILHTTVNDSLRNLVY